MMIRLNNSVSMASLWFTMYDIEHRVFDGKLYLVVKDIVGKEIEIQISNAEVNERARLQNELTIEKYLINITDKERDILENLTK